MDVNWYASEKIVEDTLRAQRAPSELRRLAAVSPPSALRRRFVTVLITLANTLTHSRRNGVGRSRTATV